MNPGYVIALGGTQMTVGLSAIIKYTPAACMTSVHLKIHSGGGTLEIINPPASLSGAGTVGWGAGYPVGATEIVAADGPAVFYLAATGATMVIDILTRFSPGTTLSV